MHSVIFLLTFSNLLFSQTKKEQIILDFLDVRYGGKVDSVSLYLDPNFVYNQMPYVGLGISTNIDSKGLRVSSVSPFGAADSLLNKDDIILEVNGVKASKDNIYSEKLNFFGAEGDTIEIVFTRDTNEFKTVKLPLVKNQLKQGLDSFLSDIQKYNDSWYEYDLEVLDYFSRKNKMLLHYQWDGVVKEGGPTYHWSVMEIIQTDPISRKILSIDAIWTEKQFRDQFK